MPKPHRIRISIAVLSILLQATALFIACSGGTAVAREERGTTAEVSICLGGAPGIFPLVAIEKGFLASEGVTVELKRFPTTTEGLKHFFKGECDFSSISETSVVMKSFERQDFSVLATVASSDDSTRILANRKSAISTANDLKGKRILVAQWSSNHFFLDMFLARHGMSEKDISLVVSGVPDPAAAFTSGSIDAFCATAVVVDKPRKALGGDAVVFDAPGLCLASFQIVAMKELINSRPEVVRKVLGGLLKTEEWIKANKNEAVKVAATAEGMEEMTMAEIWESYRWRVDLSQSLLVSLEQEARWAIDAKYTSRQTIPNYLDFVYREGLLALKPQAVTILP